MTEQQDVLSPRRRKRHGNSILLGSIPVAVALTALLTAGTWTTASQPPLSAATPHEATSPAPTASIHAPEAVAQVDAAALIHHVEVVLPPVPAAVTTPVRATPVRATAATHQATAKQTSPQKSSADKTTAKKTTTTKSTAKKTTTKKSPKKAETVSFAAYCASAKATTLASGGPKALLAAANKERAHLGYSKLSWSSSLASAATKWSKTLAAADSKTKEPADKLSHNPNRPGAENVAVSYASTGLSQSNAIARAHKNWMPSNGHCKNIMNPAYSTMGAGTGQTTDGTTWYTTQNFR